MNTPISFLFSPATPGNVDWNALFAYSPALQRTRLSWRQCDARFAAFIDFLEGDGAQTTLDDADWQARFAAHLDYIANRHFLFMLWMGATRRNGESGSGSGSGSDDPSAWLPAAHAAQFADWARRERADAALMESLENVSLADVPRPMPAFRGTPLRSVFMYRAFQKVIGLHAQPPKE